MFEQSSYEQEPVATPLETGDLFHNYELRTWDLDPRIYKILIISAIGNILAILIVAQTSLLTMKGCDSPLVGRVCEVLDTVYVGSMLFGTDREYVDAEYDKTVLGDDEEIIFVDVTNNEPLSYPEGYFALANPDEYARLNNPFGDPLPTSPNELAPGIPYTTPYIGGKSLIDTPQKLPKKNPNVVDPSDLPDFPTNNSDNPTLPGYKPGKNNSGKKPPLAGNDTVATANPKPTPSPTPAPTPMSSEAVNSVEINKKPLTDFADGVSTKWEAKEIDLNQPFTVVLNGVITPDGKLDRDKSKFDVSKQKGDQKMIDIAKGALEALGDSGYLTYLKSLDVDKVTATISQDDTQITVVISSAQKTVERAKQISSGMNLIIDIGKGRVQDPSDEMTLLNGAKVTAEGKNFVLNFAIPKPIAQEMITRKLKEASAKKAEQSKPNGNSMTKPVNNTGQR